MSYSQAPENQESLSSVHLRAVEEQVLLLQRSETQPISRGAHLRDQHLAGRYFRQVLESASPYYWEWQICEIIEASRNTIPEWNLRASDLVTAYGFSWFGQPLPFYDPYSVTRNQGTPHRDQWMLGFLWGSAGDSIWLYSLYQANPVITPDGRQLGGGARVGRGFRWRFGEPILGSLMEELPDRNRGRILRELAYLSGSLLFLSQRIVRIDSRGEDRHFDVEGKATRSHAEPTPILRAVQLRRVETKRDSDGDAKAVDWSHRWMVSAHWRQQYYPSLDEHRPVLVMPYIKGPENKPLKPPPARVFAVVR